MFVKCLYISRPTITSLHVVVSSSSNGVIKGISNKQSQSRFVGAIIQDSSPLSSNIKIAKDIQLLLNNIIGAATRASMTQIEMLINEAPNKKSSQHVTTSDIIDLIARVRSV